MITIRKTKSIDVEHWNSYVEKHESHSPYHLFHWQHAVELAYQHKAHYLIAEENNTVVGVFPLIAFKIPFSKQSFCALPFCDVGGILADTPAIAQKLLDKSKEIAQQLHINKLETRSGVNYHIITEPNSRPENNEKVRMMMPLPDSSEILFSSFKSKLRSQIRKAEKNGLRYETGSSQILLTDFYEVFAHNMRALGSPVHARNWFSQLQKHYQDKMLISVVYKDQLPVGAGIVLMTASKASIPWASTKAEFNRLSPNMMLYWSFLKHLSDNGIAEFDFGRSSYGEGTFKFKQQWGALPVPLNWQEIQFHEESNNDDSAKNHETGSKGKSREIIEAIWRKLPLSVTVFLGPKVRKYISL